jgi:hypothetical protein
MRREYKDSRLVSRAYSEELPDREGDGPEVHSATPELLNSCNSLNYRKPSNFWTNAYVRV